MDGSSRQGVPNPRKICIIFFMKNKMNKKIGLSYHGQPYFYDEREELVFVLHLSFMLLDKRLLDVVRNEFVA